MKIYSKLAAWYGAKPKCTRGFLMGLLCGGTYFVIGSLATWILLNPDFRQSHSIFWTAFVVWGLLSIPGGEIIILFFGKEAVRYVGVWYAMYLSIGIGAFLIFLVIWLVFIWSPEKNR